MIPPRGGIKELLNAGSCVPALLPRAALDVIRRLADASPRDRGFRFQPPGAIRPG